MFMDLSSSVAGARSCLGVVVAVGARRMAWCAPHACSVLSSYTWEPWQFLLGVRGLEGESL